METRSHDFAVETAAAAARRIEARFRDIAEQRMAGLPFLNPALGVEAVALRVWQGQWLCALVTGWSLNILLLPQAAEPGAAPPAHATVGSKRIVSFPGGCFEFIGAHDDVIGSYGMCSLFSPVLEFGDHATAVAAAEVAIAALFESTQADEPEDADMLAVWRGEIDASPPPPTVEPAAATGADASDEGSTPMVPVRPAASSGEDAFLDRRRLLFGSQRRRDA